MVIKKRNTGVILVAVLCVVYFTSYISRLNFSAVMAEIIKEGVLTKTQAGVIGTALFISYGVGQLLSGWLGDRIKPHYIILFGLLLTATCNALMSVVSIYFLFVFIWGINGFAQAMLWPPMVKIMNENLSEERYAKACTWVIAVSQFATVAIYLFVPLCIEIASWKSAFYVPSIVAICVAVVWFFFYKRLENSKVKKQEIIAGTIETAEEVTKLSVLRIFLASGMFFVLASIILQGFLRDGITSWLPTLLSENFKMETTVSILLNVVSPIFGICAVYLSSFLYRKYFKNEVLSAIIYFCSALVFCVILVFTRGENIAITLVFSALTVGCMHAINMMLISYIPRRFKNTGKISTISGITNACTYIGSALSSFGFAEIANNVGWGVLIIVWAVICLIAVLLLLCSHKKFLSFIKQ